MNSVSLNKSSNVIDQTLSEQVVGKIIKNAPLPIDIIKWIAPYIDKPKYIARCCRLSPEIKKMITEENDTNKKFWIDHVAKRWGKFASDPSRIKDGIVIKKIEEYGIKYLTEKRALKYYQVLEMYDPFSLFKQIPFTKAIILSGIVRNLLPYVQRESPKATFLYLVGHSGLEAHRAHVTDMFEDNNFCRRENFIKLLEKAGKKGHAQAAFETGLEYLPNYFRDCIEDIEKGVKWLKFAANNNHKNAKEYLNYFETKKWGGEISDPYFDSLPDEIQDKIREIVQRPDGDADIV